MRTIPLIKKAVFSLLVLLAGTFSSNAQMFWVENFGDSTFGLASAYASFNGSWAVNDLGGSGGASNLWYVSCAERGYTTGNCGDGCAGPAGLGSSLHLGAHPSIAGDIGAAYYAGPGGSCTTNKRAESPTIDCSGRSNITLSFYYIENGQDSIDDGSVYYYDGTSWVLLANPNKTALCGSGQGQWAHFSVTLPASADNNPNVKIGFLWVNNEDGIGTDPSFAIDSMSLMSMPSTLPCYLPSSGLVAWYPFNGNANDGSGNEINGTVSGASLSSDRFGNANNAYSFNGTSDYIEIPYNSLFDNATYSFSFWVKTPIATPSPGGPDVNPGIITRTATGGAGLTTGASNPWAIFENFGNCALATAGCGGTPCIGYATAQAFSGVSDNSWHHLVFTVSPDLCICYKDGIKTDSNYYSTAISYLPYVTRIGRSLHTYWKAFYGNVDDIAIYNRVLSPEEIAQLYTGGSGGVSISGLSTVNIGATISLTPSVGGGTWNSSNAHASVNSGGVVTGISVGTSTISYTVTNSCGSFVATMALTISGGDSGTTLPCYVPSSGLVAWYPFNGNANDESGNGFNGVNNGAILTTDRFGNTNKAYYFDGDSSFIQSPVNQTNISQYSISAWFKTDLGGTIVSGWTAPSDIAVTLYMHNAPIDEIGYLGYIADGNSFQKGKYTNLPYNDSTWHHIVGVWSGISGSTISSSDFVIYIDGNILPQTDANVSSATAPISGTLGTFIGKHIIVGSAWHSYFHGILDDIAIFDRALTSSEVTQLYTSGSSAVSISGFPTVNVGATVSFTSSVAGGTWSSSNTNVSVNASGIVTGISAGTSMISYTITNSCGSSVATMELTISGGDSGTSISPIIGSTTVCVGSIITLSDETAGGTWSSSNTSVATVDVSGVVTGVGSGTATITYIVSGVFVSTTVTVSSSAPVVGTLFSPVISFCPGSVFAIHQNGVLRVDAPSGIAGSLNYTIANDGTGTTGAWGSVAIPLSGVEVKKAPAPDTLGCTGDSSVLYGGKIALIFRGSCEFGFKALQAQNAGALACIIVNNIPGGGAVGMGIGSLGGSVTIPVYNISYEDGVAIANVLNGGGVVTMSSILPVSGGVWSSSNSSVATIDASGTVTGTGAGSVTFSYTVTNGCGSNTATTAEVTGTGLPDPGTISGLDSLCIFMGAYYGATVAGGTWSSDNTTIAFVDGAGFVSGQSAGNATISYGVSNMCGTSYASKPVNIRSGELPNQGLLTGNNSVCVGGSTNLYHVAGRLQVTAPASIAGVVSFAEADHWGGALTPLMGQELKMGDVSDTDGCAAFPPGYFSGKVALIFRGSCEFGVKARNAQDAGAVACLIANNNPDYPFHMGAASMGSTVTIPSYI